MILIQIAVLLTISGGKLMDGTVCSTMSKLLQTNLSIEEIGPLNKTMAGEATSTAV